MTQDIKILGGVGIVTLILIVGAAILMGGSPSQSQKVDQSLLIRSDSNKISTSSAKLNLVEFGDYQCPACKAAYPVVKQLLSDEKGKINFVFRNYPFLGQESTWAGEAAECAAEQGKFWEYHDYLYSHQGAENSGTFSKNKLEEIANTLALNSTQFSLCLETDKYSQKVSQDLSDGRALGVNSTPTFFLDGEKIVGISSYADFKSKIDSKLKK